MDVITLLIGNMEKVCKYISFGTFLFAIFIGSFIIYNNDVGNIYVIVGVYAGCLFMSRALTIISKGFFQLCSYFLWHTSKFLSKLWDNLSDAEQKMLVEMYYSEDKSLEIEMINRTVLLLEQRGLVVRPVQRSDGFTATYIMQGNAEKMVKENYKESRGDQS